LAFSVIVGAGGGGGEPFTVTVTERCTEPPAPVHCRVNVLLWFRTGLCSEPEAGLFPAHAPEAVHPLALVEVQLSVERAPAATVVGLALSVSVGAATIDTVACRCVVPPAPVHESVKVDAAEKGPTLWLPEVCFDPAQPLRPPLPVQLVALLVVQLSVELPPTGTEAGAAEKFTVGAGVPPVTVTVTARFAVPPPVFVQVSVNVLVAANGPTISLPEVPLLPLHAPEAVHAFAFVVDHVSCEVPCGPTEVGFAARLTVGSVTAPPPGTAIGWVDTISSSYSCQPSAHTLGLRLVLYGVNHMPSKPSGASSSAPYQPPPVRL
jgi:hypothetical protein